MERKTRNQEYLRFYSFRFVGPPGGDSNLAWKTIDDFQRGTEDSLSLCMSVEIEKINFNGEFDVDSLRLPSIYLEESTRRRLQTLYGRSYLDFQRCRD